MALGNNYLKINGNSIFNPTSLQISDTNVETVKQSEDGHDLAVVTRLCKRVFSFSFTATSTGYATIKTYCQMASVTLTWNGESIIGRLRLTGAQLMADSEHCDRTNGIWTLSVTFSEI